MLLSANLLIILAVVLAVIGAACLVRGVSGARRARDAAFYGTRREARLSSNRYLTVAFVALALSAGSFVMRGALPDLTVERVWAVITARVYAPAPLPEAPLPTAVAQSEATRDPSLAPTSETGPKPAAATQTPEAIPSATQMPTATRAATRAATASPRVEQRMQLHALASGISSTGEPVDVRTRFESRTRTIHVFFTYHDVPPSASIRHTWFHNGGSAYFGNDMLDRFGSGVASISWTPDGGFEPGLYEVRVLLGNVPQFVANFEVR